MELSKKIKKATQLLVKSKGSTLQVEELQTQQMLCQCVVITADLFSGSSAKRARGGLKLVGALVVSNTVTVTVTVTYSTSTTVQCVPVLVLVLV